MTTTLKNEPIYTFELSSNNKPLKRGEISGEFKVLQDFEKYGYMWTLVCDYDGVYLIIQ